MPLCLVPWMGSGYSMEWTTVIWWTTQSLRSLHPLWQHLHVWRRRQRTNLGLKSQWICWQAVAFPTKWGVEAARRKNGESIRSLFVCLFRIYRRIFDTPISAYYCWHPLIVWSASRFYLRLWGGLIGMLMSGYRCGNVWLIIGFFFFNFIKSWKTSAVSTTVWMVETQLCKLRGTSDMFV